MQERKQRCEQLWQQWLRDLSDSRTQIPMHEDAQALQARQQDWYTFGRLKQLPKGFKKQHNASLDTFLAEQHALFKKHQEDQHRQWTMYVDNFAEKHGWRYDVFHQMQGGLQGQWCQFMRMQDARWQAFVDAHPVVAPTTSATRRIVAGLFRCFGRTAA